MRVLFLVLVSCCYLQSIAQDLYEPRNIKLAYANNTRSRSGQPGSAYWQNGAVYDIHITALPPDRTIKGTETITYFNKSPDTLQYIVVRLVPNIHRAGSIRYTPASPAYLTGGVQIDSFAVGGAAQPWEEDDFKSTVYPVKLPTPLHPGDSVQLYFAWHYTLSQQGGREGALDSTSFFLAYFYPRVAVYDDYNGWDVLEFNDLQEFYNDFNDYTLNVSVPASYLVWATGTLQNGADVLQPAAYRRLQTSLTADTVVPVATLAQLVNKKVTKQGDMNTWRFAARHITDVTAALSDHYVWDAASVVVDSATQRRVSMQAAYVDTAKDFRQMVQFGREALSWFSHQWPGVPYPYPKMTAVQGTADMEYPMMINDSPTDNLSFSRFVAEHEIAHSYFPFYMGINETRYPFMDEGWATFFEYLIGKAHMGAEQAEDLFKNFRVVNWLYNPAQEEDLPIITPAYLLSGSSYSNNAYGKPALAYLALKDMLGDSIFRRSLHTYMNRWQGKHPTPWDFFYTFNEVTGSNLNWFWHPWFFANGYIDIAVQRVEQQDGRNVVYVQNVGGFPVPFDVRIRYTDGSSASLHQTALVWNNGGAAVAIPLMDGKTIRSLRLDNGIFMDANEKDNNWKGR